MSNTGFIFGVLFTEDGTVGSKFLGYQIVLADLTDDNHRVIVHRRVEDDAASADTALSIGLMLQGSLEWAAEKYPLYVVDKTRVRKGPMPPHPDEVSKTNPARKRVVLELAIAVDETDIAMCDAEDLLHTVLVESDRLRRAGIEIHGVTGPR